MKKDHASVSDNPPTLELNKKILTVEDSRETREMARNFSKEQMLTGLSALSQFAPKDFTVAPEKLNAAEKEAGLNVGEGPAIR